MAILVRNIVLQQPKCQPLAVLRWMRLETYQHTTTRINLKFLRINRWPELAVNLSGVFVVVVVLWIIDMLGRQVASKPFFSDFEFASRVAAN